MTAQDPGDGGNLPSGGARGHRPPPSTFAGEARPNGSAFLLLLAAFGAYFSMYALRKPITVTEFGGEYLPGTGVELKTALLVGQILGYAISKFLGIRICSTLRAEWRARTLVGLILLAELSLCTMAILPPGWQVMAMFINGLPLGMVWGLVIRYLEGRRISDLLLAGLSASYVLSSGVVKDVGRWLMVHGGISEEWMPAAAGALFLIPFLASVALLERAPGPDQADELERVHRKPMSTQERGAFLRRFGAGLIPLVMAYLILTAYRDFRDNYGIEVFRELGFLEVPGLFTRTELPAAVGVVLLFAFLTRVRNSRRALKVLFGIMTLGSGIVLGSTWLFRAGSLDGLTWMILCGVGAYMAYTPVGAMLFDRLTAADRVAGTAVFGIYVADAVGYGGSVGVQLFRDLGAAQFSRLEFFVGLSQITAWGGLLLLPLSGILMMRALGGTPHSPSPPAEAE
ncbi:DUF5690 family protein [Gemmatimonadota bacterium]